MTMNYCGRCGAANGTAARYCRQCGAELHNQAAMSSSSTPLNVEFSARSAPKDHQRDTRVETNPTVPPEKADTAKLRQPETPTGKIPTQTTTATPPANGNESADPKAISESLKKVRASGPLLMEAVRKKQER
ncbi:MAG: zinc-ribbon domain-containing protein, partial [Blastocatellia bacterium]